MKLIGFILHALLDYLLGKSVLDFLPSYQKEEGTFFVALLLGILLETTISFFILWLGGSVTISLFCSIILISLLNYRNLIQIIKERKISLPDFKSIFQISKTLKWYEWLFSLFILEKIFFILWQLFRLPTIFSDAIVHWSLKALAIYSGANWSMIYEDPTFLGKNLHDIQDYPLQLPLWRATSALLTGEWNEFVSRSDGLLFFIIIIGLTGTTFYRLTNKRWMALGAAFVIASLPLQVWHAASGYGDIAVEAYLLATTVHFIKKDWWLMGLFAAGTIWSKNDGLAVYLPGLIAGLCCFLLFAKGLSLKVRFKNLFSFGMGISIIIPWLVFQSMYTLSIIDTILAPLKAILFTSIVQNNNFYGVLMQSTPTDPSISSIQLFWNFLFLGPTFGLFWWAIFLGLLLSLNRLLFDNMGRSLLLFFLISCAIIYYIFTFTPAYEFLLIQTTIHRTMLQLSGAAWVVLGYAVIFKAGLSQKTKER